MHWPHFYYGADYNPEQWNEVTLEEDLQLMQDSKVNLVSLGIFSWARLEPEEGRYDFDWLAKIMDRLYAFGIDVDLATGTASPPAWMAKNYPETLPVNERGEKLGFGSRQQYVPASPIFREKTVALVERLATYFRDHPALKMWHVSNEYGCHIWQSFDPVTVDTFRTWLKKKYGRIEAVNEAWNTNFWAQTYSDFTQIGAPASLPTFPNPGQSLDWKRFSSDMLVECLNLEVEVLKRITPEIPVTTNFMELYPNIDYWKMAKKLDFISDDSYPDPADPTSAARVALAGDLSRSLGKGKPYLLMEQTPQQVQWRPEGNTPKRKGQYRNWSLSRIARGANGIMHFQWRQSPGGAETMHSAMVNHAGRKSYGWKNMVSFGKELNKLGDLLGEQTESKVAMILDWEAMWGMQTSCGPAPIDPFQELINWHKTCFEAGYTVDFVQVGTDLSKYKLILVPGLITLPKGLKETLRSAAKTGATILVTAPFGVYDHNQRAILGGYHGNLSEVTGVKVLDLYPNTRPDYERWSEVTQLDRISSHISAPAGSYPVMIEANAYSALARTLKSLDGVALHGKLWGEVVALENENVQVEAVFSSVGALPDLAGLPAVTRHRWLKGEIWYLATDLKPLGQSVIFKTIAEQSGLTTGEEDWLPAGVEVIRRGKYMFAINHSEYEVELPEPKLNLLTSKNERTIPARNAIIFAGKD